MKINTLWRNEGVVELIDLGEDFFLTKFSVKEDYYHALTGVPLLNKSASETGFIELNTKVSTPFVSYVGGWVIIVKTVGRSRQRKADSKVGADRSWLRIEHQLSRIFEGLIKVVGVGQSPEGRHGKGKIDLRRDTSGKLIGQASDEVKKSKREEMSMNEEIRKRGNRRIVEEREDIQREWASGHGPKKRIGGKLRAKKSYKTWSQAFVDRDIGNELLAVWVKWKPPDIGMVKLNSDGSVDPLSKQASTGGVIRREDGNWIRGYMMNIGRVDAMTEELWGLRESLKLTRDLQLRNIQVEEYRDLLNVLGVSGVVHVFREMNICADRLALMGRNSPRGITLMEHLLHELIKFLEEDVTGLGKCHASSRGRILSGSLVKQLQFPTMKEIYQIYPYQSYL
ncbi:LOW QUALITY PROTEIN: Ribonuclease H domain [Dillenia turbinata]|uniref:Ribonuclease H domain n=1 Tax=Dillenia turbinata TaxID=194707 RepID=A0AAN8Z7D0_9MAGN